MFSIAKSILLLPFLAFFLSRPLFAVEAKLTLLFTGDQDGQIEYL
jgi:hypothetical protein